MEYGAEVVLVVVAPLGVPVGRCYCGADVPGRAGSTGCPPAPGLAVSAIVRPEPGFGREAPREAWANRGQARWS